MSNVRHLGRFRTADAGRPTSDLAEKTMVAEFDGPHFIAEREGDKLVVYSIGGEDGTLGVNVVGATGDRAVKTLADLQRTFDAKYPRKFDRRYNR
jgi:hypothetical protein